MKIDVKTTTMFLLVAACGIFGCGTAEQQPGMRENETEGELESELLGRTTAEICGAAEPRWGVDWGLADASGEKRAHVRDAVACANRSYWLTRYRPAAVHLKFYLHRQICTQNPASHYAMQQDQAEFYCSFSLHLRMCNTQGLYALKDIPDSEPRRAREKEIFSECLNLSGELEHFRTGLQMSSSPDAEVASTVARLYDQYKVQPGVRIAPAVVNPDRAKHALFEKLVRTSFYGVTVPMELLESTFSDAFLAQDGVEPESQLKLISSYRSHLRSVNGTDLLDVSGLPICANGQKEPGEQCDDGNSQPGDGCSEICTRE